MNKAINQEMKKQVETLQQNLDVVKGRLRGLLRCGASHITNAGRGIIVQTLNEITGRDNSDILPTPEETKEEKTND